MARVHITDVFLRDGLQDENVILPTLSKLELATQLAAAGLTSIEVGSFVSSSRVPQMGDTADLLARLRSRRGVVHTVLALNARGITRAVEAGAQHINLAASASAAHSLENAGCAPETILAGMNTALNDASMVSNVRFTACVATAFSCPFEGDISASRLVDIVGSFLNMGVATVGLADTLGTTPSDQVLESVRQVQLAYPGSTLGLHLHNARGQAFDTALAAVALGVTRFDAAVAGFGGCPFAPGAAGNVATEELVSVMHRAGHVTGIDELAIGRVASAATAAVGRGLPFSPGMS